MAAIGSFDEFIPLDRTFHELTLEDGATDDVDLTRRLGRSHRLQWPDLLGEYRVVLLSEAGSGKTDEIRHVARELRRNGRRAFFVRIEHIVQNFEDAFEEGTFEEFSSWASSAEEGWLLLDSVDEARLRDPKDFELAIKKIGRFLRSVLQHTHVVLTGRTTAWRPKTDLLLCRTELPYQRAEKAADDDASTAKMRGVSSKKRDAPANPAAPFTLVALDDLNGAQIDAFLSGKRIHDVRAFRDAVERKDAWSLTTRPQDLAELVEFWKDHGRIGSRLELMKSSIARRLDERDQNRSEARPITLDRLRLGARLVAAANTLGRESAIRVPDGAENVKGIAVREVLTDWNDIDCATLLSRPIFDEGIYGTVRFHHRSVREYLTAEWLHALITDEGSRERIESLFFRSQYGIEVIVPTMRRHPLEVIVFSNEEGGTIGSHAVASGLTEKQLGLATNSGKTVRDGITFIGGDPSKLAQPLMKRGDLTAYLELHIEQGGILDAERLNIGIVEGIVGINQWDVTIDGFANHAGTTPMDQRHDALLAASRYIDAVNRVVTSVPGRQVGTVGRIQAFPGAYNVIPGRVVTTLELRDLGAAKILTLFERIKMEVAAIEKATGTTFTFQSTNTIVPAPTDPAVRAVIDATAKRLGFTTKVMPSGAGHDAQEIAVMAPVGMIFVPSRAGISHSPKEFSSAADITNGANVLLQTLLALDAR